MQFTIFSQAKLISGSVDLILLALAALSLHEKIANKWLWSILIGIIVSIISAMPFYSPLIGYIGVIYFSRRLQKRVWQTPLFEMLIVVFLSTIFQHSIYIFVLLLNRAPISITQSLDSIVLPSILLNLLLSLPVYAIVQDLTGRFLPLETEA